MVAHVRNQKKTKTYHDEVNPKHKKHWWNKLRAQPPRLFSSHQSIKMKPSANTPTIT